MSLVAVLDIGKTNAKLLVVDATGREIWSAQRGNAPLAGAPWLAIDAGAIESFLLDALARCPWRRDIGALVPVAHGACAALVDGDGLVLPVLDYEEPALDEIASSYRAERGRFSETMSPMLPRGLNLGRQLMFLEERHGAEFRRTGAILPWPQYWAWRLSGVMASEVTSLGCHTDLWHPEAGGFSTLARRRGWDRLMPPLRRAGDRLGTIRPELAARTGLSPDAMVLAGLHDSNASFLRHRAHRPADKAFAVLSSGTWAIIMAAGVALDRLDEARDCLANVDATGAAVATARFMGGREHAAIAGGATGTEAGLAAVIERGILALPSFTEAGGPFPGRRGRIVGEIGPESERGALAALYLALVTEVALDLIGARGRLIIEGPLAADPLFAPILAALRPQQPVALSDDRAGTVGGALSLVLGTKAPAPMLVPALAIEHPGLAAYREGWLAAVRNDDPG